MSGIVNVSMEGVRDAVDTVKEIVVPFQKEQAERRIKLDNTLRQAEIQRLNAQALAEQAKVEHEKAAADLDRAQADLTIAQAKKTEAEARLVLAQAEKTLAEAEKEREAMKLERIKLAVQIVERYNPKADGAEKINFIMKLLPEIERLLSGGIQLLE